MTHVNILLLHIYDFYNVFTTQSLARAHVVILAQRSEIDEGKGTQGGLQQELASLQQLAGTRCVLQCVAVCCSVLQCVVARWPATRARLAATTCR